MVVAARRAYNDAIRWIKRARPPRLRAWRLARRLFRICFLGSLLVLGAIGLMTPAKFGSPRSRPGGGLEWWVLAGLMAVCLAWCLSRRRAIQSGASRLAEPFRRPLDRFEPFEPMVHALLAAPAALRTRFAVAWVWGPAAAVAVAAFLAASAAYFLVDAILARGEVGWEQPVLAALNATASLLLLRLVAKRLATWRLALSVHREVTGSYG